MITKEKKELLRLYNLGLAAYKQRKWGEAVKNFAEALKIDPADGPSEIYFERAKNYMDTPPSDDWDGVFTMTTK